MKKRVRRNRHTVQVDIDTWAMLHDIRERSPRRFPSYGDLVKALAEPVLEELSQSPDAGVPKPPQMPVISGGGTRVRLTADPLPRATLAG